MAQVQLKPGEGVAGTVMQRRRGVIVNDYRHWPAASPLVLEHSRIAAMLAEPLVCRDGLVGVMVLDNDEGGPLFMEEDRGALALFASQAAIAIENAKLYAAAVRRGEETAALLMASRVVMAGLDLQSTLRRIAEEAARIAQCQNVKVLLRDPDTQALRVGAVVGRQAALLEDFAGVGEHTLSAIVGSTGQLLFVPDCAHDPRNPFADQDRALGLTTYLGLPIKIRDEVVGVLTVNPTQPRDYTSDDLAYLAAFATLAALAIENARLFEALRAAHAHLEALSRRQIDLQEQERRALARELHDEIGQLLTGLKLTLDGAGSQVPPESQASLREAGELVSEIISLVRELSLSLRPAMLDDLGLLPALLWLFERYTARTQIRVDFEHVALEGRPCPPEVETAAYRIVQEALTNVARHAQVGAVRVRARVEQQILAVLVEDQGRGFEPSTTLVPGVSNGLAGMRERATSLTGQLRIESSPGAGTRVLLELPLDARGQP